MVLVILGGLLLGGLLTMIFGAGGTAQAPTARPSFTPLPGTTATFAPTASPTSIETPTAASVATPTPVLITGANSADHAAAIVRAYIGSLARGDSATAAGYLASGLPTESFINPNVTVNVADLRTGRTGDGGYAVTAQIVTSKGTYLTSFTLRMGTYGMQITDHSATHI